MKIFFKHVIGILVHPVSTYYMIKETRKQYPIKMIFILVFLLLPVRILSLFLQHYPIATVELYNMNFLIELLKVYLPLILIICVTFAVTSIMDGESTFGEVAYISCLCTTPYLLMTLPVALASNLMSKDEVVFFNFLNIVIFIWIFILYLVYLSVFNSYTFGQFSKVTFVIVFGIVVSMAILFILIILATYFIGFIQDIILEIKYALLS